MKKYFYAVIFLLTSCSVLSPVKTDQQFAYIVNAMPTPTIKKSPHPHTLYVMQMNTNAVYRTKQMAYSARRYQIGYYVNHAWADRPAEMLKPLIMQALENTQHFHALVGDPSPSHYDYILTLQIQTFLQDYTTQPGNFYLTIQAQLLNATTNHVTVTKEFALVEPIQQIAPYAGVAAANKATARFLQQLTQFCVRSI